MKETTLIAVPNFITHYYYPDKKPFRNIMDIDEEERIPIVKELNLRMERGETQRGFPDWYFVQRKKAEEKLLESVIKKGLIPERIRPYYFVLGSSNHIEQIYNHNCSSIALSFPENFDNLFFSIGDSLWCFADSEDPTQKWKNQWFQGQLYNFSEVCKILNELAIDLNKPETILGKRIGLVEAFIWSDQDLNTLAEYTKDNK